MTAQLDRLVRQNLEYLDTFPLPSKYLLESGNFADAEIVCNGRTWKVHKLILRSRCPWFEKAFANNWKEAQTGQVVLKEQRPEEIDLLLKFIYSGGYVPDVAPNVQCFQTPNLKNNVSLWRTADFFLVSDLKVEIQEYLVARFAGMLSCFHDFRLSLVDSEAVHTYHVDQDNVDVFFVDLSEAVTKIYKSPGARQLHKMFAIFACGLREHWPAQIMRRLMKDIPQFREDISTALIAIHFPKITNDFVSGGLDKLCVNEAWNAHSAWSTKDFISFRCSGCGKESPRAVVTRSSRSRGWNMTLDPFSLGMRKWCDDCAFVSIKSLLKTMINGWPSGIPGSD